MFQRKKGFKEHYYVSHYNFSKKERKKRQYDPEQYKNLP